MKKVEAESLVQRHLDESLDLCCTVVAKATERKDWGFIVYYESSAYLESGSLSDRLAGNGPIFVNERTGELYHAGTAHPTDYYVRQYERSIGHGA